MFIYQSPAEEISSKDEKSSSTAHVSGNSVVDEVSENIDSSCTGTVIAGSDCETVEGLKTQLATLMQSLATLSEEKSRMEACFQADKKSLRSEKEEVYKQLFKIYYFV